MRAAGGPNDGRGRLERSQWGKLRHLRLARQLRGTGAAIVAVSLAGGTGCFAGAKATDASAEDANAAGDDASIATLPDGAGDSGPDVVAVADAMGGDATASVDATMPSDAVAPVDATASSDAAAPLDAPVGDVADERDAATAVDAMADAMTPADASDAAAASDAPTADSSGADAESGAGNDSLDGTWAITGITCNGVPSYAQSIYTAPNSFTETFAGSSLVLTFVTVTDAGASCTESCPYTTTISGSMASSVPNGVCGCVPAACATFCGMTPTGGTYTDTFQVTGNTLTFTTPPTTPDTVCTAPGQSNPVAYTGVKQ